MTWSIVARDDSGALGIAIASRFFAVGALCPYVVSGVGAVSTQDRGEFGDPFRGDVRADVVAEAAAGEADQSVG